MKNRSFMLIFLAIFCLFPPPLFSQDYLNNPAYIAQNGSGASPAEAEHAALASLSRFFQMSVSVAAQEHTTVTNAGAESTLSEDIAVRSETDLFAVHYTKAQFDKKQKRYELTAYIDRAETWRIYESRLSEAARPFEALCAAAESQTDPLLKIIGYSQALQSAQKTDLAKKCDFATILNPNGVVFYEQTRETLSELAPRIRTLSAAVSVFVWCEADYENRVLQSVRAYFSAGGIAVSDDQNAAYRCAVSVTENAQTLAAGTFFAPSYTVKITKDGQTLFSCARQLKKTGAKNEGVAKQRAYAAIAESVRKTLHEEFAPF